MDSIKNYEIVSGSIVIQKFYFYQYILRSIQN